MKYHHFILGASIGVGSEPTAIAIIEQEVWVEGRERPETHERRLRWFDQFPPDCDDPETVERINALLERPEIKEAEDTGHVDVILDTTASGRAIVDLFKGPGIKLYTVTIGGTEEDLTDPNWRIPKVEAIGNLRTLIQSHKLKVMTEHKLVKAFTKEVLAYRPRRPPVNPNDPEAWRERPHDDIVFAAAVAAWRAKKHTPRLKRGKIVYPPNHVSNYRI